MSLQSKIKLIPRIFALYNNIFFTSQIGYSQSASLLAHNLIAAIAAFPWESALPRKQGSPTHRFRLGGLEAGDFLDEVKKRLKIFISSPYDFFSIPQNSQQASMSEEVFRKKPLGRRQHLMSSFARSETANLVLLRLERSESAVSLEYFLAHAELPSKMSHTPPINAQYP